MDSGAGSALQTEMEVTSGPQDDLDLVGAGSTSSLPSLSTGCPMSLLFFAWLWLAVVYLGVAIYLFRAGYPRSALAILAVFALATVSPFLARLVYDITIPPPLQVSSLWQHGNLLWGIL